MTNLKPIYRDGKHPARALYRYWRDLILMQYPTLRHGANASVGSGRHGRIFVDSETDWTIVFGHRFALKPDGRFSLSYMWGYQRRWHISDQTFLSYGHFRSGYQWCVDLGFQEGGYWGYRNMQRFDDPNDRRRYVSERLMEGSSWRNVWLELEPVDDGWRIRPALNQTNHPWSSLRRTKRQELLWNHQIWMQDWRRYEALVERRYEQIANPNIGGSGRPKRSVGPATVLRGGESFTGDEAVEQMVAVLDVYRPAKSVPLIREAHKEAPNGDHLVTCRTR